MEQLTYNPVNFDSIVPVFDLDSAEASLQNSFANEQLNANLTQMQANANIEKENLTAYQTSLGELSKLSKAASDQFIKIKNQQSKNEAVELFAKGIQDGIENPVSQEQLVKAFKEAEKEDDTERTDVNNAIDRNLERKKNNGGITVEDTAAANRVRTLTSDRQIIYNNGRASTAASSYGSAFTTFLTKENDKRREAGLPLLDPTSQEYRDIRSKFDQAWSEATGLYQTNRGFAASNVYPVIAQQRLSSENTYTKLYEFQVGEERRQDLTANVNTRGGLTAYFKGYTLTKNRDGTYKTIEDAYKNLSAQQLQPNVITQLGNQQVTINGKQMNFKDHPRFQSLLTEARNRQNNAYAARGTSIVNELNGIEGLDTMDDDAIDAEAEAAIAANPSYAGQIRGWAERAKGRGAEARQNRDFRDQIKEDLVKNKGQLPNNYFDDKPEIPFEVQYEFLGVMAKPDKEESVQQSIRKNDFFTGVDKGFKDRIGGILGKKIKFANATTGQPNPSNYEEFKTISLNKIAQNAQLLMFGDSSLSEDEAIRLAIEKWESETQALEDKGDLFDEINNTFKGTSLERNRGLEKASAMVIRDLDSTTADNLGKALNEQDYAELPKNGVYSERVKYLGRRFGMTPQEVVRAVRFQKGLAPLADPAVEDALSGLTPAEKAKITALGDNAPVPLLLRAQINDTKQTKIEGSAKQRTIAVGQHLLNLGYGGIWQHPNFNYDTGYSAAGGQEVGGHAPNSYHKYNEALDIGVQANGPQKLEQLYQYLNKNRERFGIAELFYDPDGSRGHPPGHNAHVHVSFGGGDSGKL